MEKSKKDKSWKIIILLITVILLTVIVYKGFKTLAPDGTSIQGEMRNSKVEFIYDLTYKQNDSIIHEQNIFSKIKDMIKEAQDFIVIDMFLFNDDYDRKNSYKNVSDQLTDTLIDQKRKFPDIEVVFITDEINTFYGSYPSEQLERLKDNGIQVLITDLEQLRDPNPLYAGVWRTFFTNLNTNKKGWLPNPFSPDSPKATMPSYLRLLNMKANHRKVVITENEALVTSFNAHDASSNHSNVALVVKGEIINDLLETENTVVKFSGGEPFEFSVNSSVEGSDKAQVITEGKIKEALIEEIENTKKGDKIHMVMFYLSNHEVVEKLLNASDRGVEIKIILDANKDAFGIEKNGVPNRPVAYNLVDDSNGEIAIRWYSTHGEQFHSKMTMFLKEEETIVIGGSANLTRRNIENYNLETNLKVVFLKDSPQAVKVVEYFDRIWSNEDAEYTLDFEAYKEKSVIKQVLYYIQEKTGLSSF
ncbi:phospholipase D family protein [Proteocatella sphenisci]|uniref:phospholipase D family protein n=1 Tax=Proteocatella sphenisci TaxID=181070 RepID=UPI00048FD26F|nr:phospholipase D family protein [Proteocatella sphenisci]